MDGRSLTFEDREGAIVDRETGTRWSILGRGLAGKLAGRTLPRLLHVDTFWFAWAAFRPGTSVHGR